MAASDKPFRSQYSLDIVYAVSCILMLLSIFWMMWQDYDREYKHEQRVFRNVEVAIAQRQALEQLPDPNEIKAAAKNVEDASKYRNEHEADLQKAQAETARLLPLKAIADARFQDVKALVESTTSFRNIALENHEDSAGAKYGERLVELNNKLAIAQKERDDLTNLMKVEQLKVDAVEGKLTKSIAALKKINDRFDAQMKIALTKRWGWGDTIRTLPIIDGFANPLKIQQFTINDIPIDYNFKQVTRFDRCMSCHLGIERPLYTRARLEKLTQEDSYKKKKDEAIEIYEERIKALAGTSDAKTVPNPKELDIATISDKVLTPDRITEFCAHPRLDLFVGSNSKHPAEKFGCTSCHAGQGSGTSFVDASHSPNSAAERQVWSHERGWEPTHMWDFPMLPNRFIESSCLKCHHEVTDLISTDNRLEAPKLLKGYSLIKENGCFGCHEISGWKNGQRIGPDLRLEPYPPLDDLNAIERTRLESDPDNRPGELRKVGPALTRISEKVHQGWIEKWLRSPSSFRPDTKMPHYFGLSNNNEKALAEQFKVSPELADQTRFPNTEIASIAYYLTHASKNYLKEAEKEQETYDAQARQKDQQLLLELLDKGRLNPEEKQTLEQVKLRIKLGKVAKLVDRAPDHPGDPKHGRLLFTERGCLACHVHQATETPQGSAADLKYYAPELKGEAVFGPNLSQLAGKFGASKEDRTRARTWLIQWILDPHLHSPRSRMPVTHLTPDEAADVAAWLLAQPAMDLGADWDKDTVTPPSHADLAALARVYLVRMLSQTDVDKFLKGELKDDELQVAMGDLGKDEQELYPKVKDDGALKSFLGKKAISRLGCFGCHDIPGFDTAKPIGVALNDWGKKAADRLAFEDIGNFFKTHYYEVNEKGVPVGPESEDRAGKEPYEEFYAQQLLGHNPNRIGYLNQKIRAPRSFDYNRIRAWDDLSRMPQFHLARARKKADEDDAAFKARMFKQEAEAREAVATFILGLVAERVPEKSINQPSGDRLAEVKGRQILEKYNCNGCHVIRPGVYDFSADPKTLADLDGIHERVAKDMKTNGEYVFLNHHDWVGRNPVTGNRLTAYGVRPTLDLEEKSVTIRLAEALRFGGDNNSSIKNIPSGVEVFFPLDALTADAKSIQSQADFDRSFQAIQPFGGAFTELMAPWLARRDKTKYISAASGEARGSLPPSLIGQGERTQPDWLAGFLLNPTPIRKMAILRMPKFNMSDSEAKTLAAYFAGVTRQINSGIGLRYPFESLTERGDLDSPYWRKKTADYVANLKRTVAKDDKGNLIKNKDGKEQTRYEQRIAAYTPLWEQVRKDTEASTKAAVKGLDNLIELKTKEKEAKKKALGEKGANKAELQKEIDAIEQSLRAIADGKADLEKSLTLLDIDAQKKTWEEKEAYAADAYRMLTSRDLCTKCHQVGSFVAGEQIKQGPPLVLAHDRLRPEWIVRWVDMPQRFVPYPTIMIPYFNKYESKYQQLYVGSGMEQIEALRDVLLNFPRVSNLPINRLHNPDMPAEKK